MLDAMWFLAFLSSIGCGGREQGEMSTQNYILIHGRANSFLLCQQQYFICKAVLIFHFNTGG